jgi:predicted RNase H-like nuclease (RuvC/YqgF family)
LFTDDGTYARFETKTSTLAVDAVNAEATYTIVVFSDAIGPFTLRAESDVEEKDIAKLENRIMSLRKELEELEAKVKALKEKSK